MQWVPYGAGFTRFEVDFAQSEQAPFTDWRIVTACGTQTTDQQEAGSGGCEISVDPASWARLAAANRGGGSIAVTVRGTTDGACASASEYTIHIAIAQDDTSAPTLYLEVRDGRAGSNRPSVGSNLWRYHDPRTERDFASIRPAALLRMPFLWGRRFADARLSGRRHGSGLRRPGPGPSS